MANVPAAGTLDVAALQRLRASASPNSPETIKAAATQFEALFLEMVMKSLRDATPSEGLIDGEQGRMMQGMLDQQYAHALASRGVGLADMLARQMAPHGVVSASATGGVTGSVAMTRTAMVNVAANRTAVNRSAATGAIAAGPGPFTPAQAFTDLLAPHAKAASRMTGLPARFMIGQAALETGWGRREILNADGSPSFNVFGIKAGASWGGKVAEVMTTEYVDGIAQKRSATFRAYGSYAEAFKDYARMLTSSPRYREAITSAADAGSFADALQRAGYATDPLYAQKLKSVIAKV